MIKTYIGEIQTYPAENCNSRVTFSLKQKESLFSLFAGVDRFKLFVNGDETLEDFFSQK